MPDPGLDRERRELERRAFAREGSGLSEVEAARLSELRRADAPAPPPTPASGEPAPAPSPSAPPPPGESRAHVPGPAPVAGEPAITAERPGPSHRDAADAAPPGALKEGAAGADAPGSRILSNGPARAVRAWLATGAWKRPRFVVGGLAVVLLAGLLVGWAIPRPPDVGLALRAGEGVRAAAILKLHDGIDPGTLQLLARDHDGLLWYATQANGMLRCAILDVRGSAPQRECQTAEQLRDQPLTVSPRTFTDQRDGYQGTLAIAGTGVPLGTLTRFEGMFYGAGLQDPEEQSEMNRLVAENDFAYAMVVGRVGETRVWIGDDGRGNRCMIVEDPDPQKACSRSTVAWEFGADGNADPPPENPPLTLRLRETAAHPALRLEYWMPSMSGQYLVITQDDALFSRSDRSAD